MKLTRAKFQSRVIHIVKKIAEKYSFETYMGTNRKELFLKKENENFLLRIGYGMGYYGGGRQNIRMFDSLTPEWLVKLNKKYLELIWENVKEDEYPNEKFKFLKGESSFNSEYWFNFSDNNLGVQFNLIIDDEEQMYLVEEAFEKYIVEYSLPLIEQTKSLEAVGQAIAGLKPLEMYSRIRTGFQAMNTNVLLLMSVLGLKGKEEIVNDVINDLENDVKEYGEKNGGIYIRRLNTTKKMFELLDDKKNIDYILTGLEEENTKVYTEIKKEPEVEEEEEFAEPPDSNVEYMILIDRSDEKINKKISQCFGSSGAKSDEEYDLGDLYEGNETIYIGNTEAYTVITLPLEELELFENEYLTDIEECLVEIYPKSKIYTIHMNKAYSIYYRLVNNGILESTALYAIDGTHFIEGKLTKEEQKMIESEDAYYDKVSALWYHHFKKMTGFDSPFTIDFAKLKLKEI